MRGHHDAASDLMNGDATQTTLMDFQEAGITYPFIFNHSCKIQIEGLALLKRLFINKSLEL